MSGALLDDRGVVEVGGGEAADFLQRLVTNDVNGLAEGTATYAALLTPQGKILVDFMAVRLPAGAGFWLDCPRDLAPDLARRLTLYRLRAKVTIADRSATLSVVASWPERPDPLPPGALAFRDPRHPDLGWRMIAERAIPPGLADDYEGHRIRAGVPRGGIDFVYGETFPHEANLDRLHGVDFKKGCYVGQEVVSRVEHRGTARKRVVAVAFAGAPPPQGAEILIGGSIVGSMGSAVDGYGLAMVRTDRVADAEATGAAASADGTLLRFVLP